MSYTEYILTHWEEPDSKARVIAKEGIVSLTPEWLYQQLQSFSPLGYKEGEVTVDLTVKALARFWKDLGGEIGVEK